MSARPSVFAELQGQHVYKVGATSVLIGRLHMNTIAIECSDL